MGRIKSAMIKRATKQLLDSENQFSEEFENNKHILGSTMPSKPIRNKIAGFMARIIRAKKNPRPIRIKVETEEFVPREDY